MRVVTLVNPRRARRGQAGEQVDSDVGIGVGAGCVVNSQGRIVLRAEAGRRIGLSDLAHRHAHVLARTPHANPV